MGSRDSVTPRSRQVHDRGRSRRRRSKSPQYHKSKHYARRDSPRSHSRDGSHRKRRSRHHSDSEDSNDTTKRNRYSRGRRSDSRDRHKHREKHHEVETRHSTHHDRHSRRDEGSEKRNHAQTTKQTDTQPEKRQKNTDHKEDSNTVQATTNTTQSAVKDATKLDRLARFKKLAEEKKLKAGDDQNANAIKLLSLKLEEAKSKKVQNNALENYFPSTSENQKNEHDKQVSENGDVDPLEFYMDTIMKESERDIKEVQLDPVVNQELEAESDANKSVTLDEIMAMTNDDITADEQQEKEFLSLLRRKTRKDTKKQQTDDSVISSDDEKPEPPTTVDYAELFKTTTRSRIEMPKVDHSTINYPPFKKNFYVQISAITAMKEHEVDALRKANGNIRVRGKNCPRPIYNFSQCGLPDPILALLQHRNYEKPFPIQMQCIPALMCGRDVLAIAETGSGKTIAYLLPAIRHALYQPKLRENEGMIVLIIAPTRELASQIGVESAKLCKLVGLRTKAVYGGAPIGEQLNALKRGAEIVCGTPGRLIEVLTISNGKVTNLRRVTFVVIDEADRMFDLGFSPQITAIVDNVRPDRQTALFSATFPPSIEALAKKILTKPLQIIVGESGKSASQVDQHVMVLHEDQKMYALLKLLGEWHEHGSIIIFVNRQLDADNMFSELIKHGYECAVLHGGQDQTDREFTLQDFRDGTKGILIATSIAARGIDVKSVVLVINYATPDHIEDYVHRVGRTGRAGNIGTSYTFITPEEGAKSHDIIKALKASNQEVPAELHELAQMHLATLDGRHKVRFGGGFGGRGFKFTDAEKSRQQQERQYACRALGFNNDTEEEEDAELAENAGAASTNKTVYNGLQSSIAQPPQKETTNPFDKPVISVSYKSSVWQFSQREPQPMIKGLTCAGYVDANTGYAHDEFGINSYPEFVRLRITNKEVLSYIMEQTGVTLQVKGRYIPVETARRNLNISGGTKGLYVEISGPTVVSVQAALSELRKVVQVAAAPQYGQPTMQKTTGRYSSRAAVRCNIHTHLPHTRKSGFMRMESDENHENTTITRYDVPRVVALGLNHALCVTKSLTFGQSNVTNQRHAAGPSEVVDATLHVHSWGKSIFNCLGHGLKVNLIKTPKPINYFERKNVSQVACGDYHSAVLVLPYGMKGGTVYTFGLGTAGRLGYGLHNRSNQNNIKTDNTIEEQEASWCTVDPHPAGLTVNLKQNVVSLACGANHTLVTTVDGSLFSWGMGIFGVLGTGECKNQYIPVRVKFPVESFMINCAAGCRHSFGLDNTGQIWAWGYGGNGRLGIGDTRSYYAPKLIQALQGCHVIQVSCGDSHSACIDKDGKVYTWGSSKGGKLGHKILGDDLLTPTVVDALLGSKIVQVECGTGITLALSESGIVYQWGAILGCVPSSSDTLPQIAHVPREVPDAGTENVFIAAGPYSCASVNVYGDLKTWGVGSCYRLGHGNVTDYLTPKCVPELRNAVFIDKIVKGQGQIQRDTANEGTEDFKVTVSANERRIQQLSVGLNHGAMLTCNGTVYTWGACNGTGYANDGENTETYYEPRLLNYFSTKIKKIACGANHTLVVTVEGLLMAWGCNDSGQLGLGDLRARGFPEQVYTVEYAINVFAGMNNSCCVTTNNHEHFANDEVGTVWVFGSASGGKLGLGDKCTVTFIMTPRKIDYISGVYKVVLGHTHSLLLQHEGIVYATGSGADGKLGNGDLETLYSFTQIQSDLKFIDIAVGASHSLAVSMEHDLYGWGRGKYINGNDEPIVQPRLIDTLPSQIGIAKVHAVVAFAHHSLVLTDQGHLIAWGDNSFGQLGVPLMTNDIKAMEFVDRPSVVMINSPVTSMATSRSFSACMTLNGDAYAWGASSDGRLGIGEVRNKVTYEPTAIATLSLMGDMLDKLESVTLQNGFSSYAAAVRSFIDELHFRGDKDVVDWKGLQILLKNEERACWEASLKAFEDDLVKCLKQHVDIILEMDKYHHDMESLKFKLEVAMQGFVNKVDNSKIRRADGNGDELGDYTQFASYIEQVLENVFLQPGYFVRLCLFGNDIATVKEMVTCVYKRLDIPRVHNQFVALLMTLLREEIQLCFNPQAPLNASVSPFARILRLYMTSRQMNAANASIFYSKGCENSFVNFMKQHRLVLPNTAPPKSEELKSFSKFIIHLSKVLSVMVVPKYVKIAFKRMHNLIKFKIPPGWTLPNVPLENVAIYPLIPTFVYAVIQPYFEDAQTLAASYNYDGINDAAVAHNFKTASQYFEYIVNPSLTMTPSASQEVNRETMSLYRNVSQMLLEYIKTLLDIEDTFNIELTMETFKTHFDLEKIRIDVPSWVVAQFLNVCAATRKYLNLSAHDPLGKILEAMLQANGNDQKMSPLFKEDLIRKLNFRQKITSTHIEHRFLMFDKSMSICRFSGVFLPQRLAYRQTTYSEDCIKLMSLIMRYVAFGRYDPLRVVQNALSELKQLDMEPGGFDAITLELENMAQYYTQLPCPDHLASNRAREACAQLMNIDRTRMTPNDIAANIMKKVLERQQQRKYLLQVYQRQGEIEIARIQFEAAFREKCQYLALCINHANTAYVEPRILNAALVNRVKLHRNKLAVAKAQVNAESATFTLSTLMKRDQITCKRAEYMQRAEQLFVVFKFLPKSGCYLSLHGQPEGANEVVQLETCDVPLYTLKKWSECTEDSFVEMFTTQAYPQGSFSIRKRFLVETFAQLME
ncbi:DEAD-box ATP-dependent RNA helicase 42 [Babesia sp. Xinjiang]|uniref:DEAD-box ATP-dependent RNA helicase 42 n=1 Tax=Babesia sp. Xinjiang TaxID=462227 RepID=UPI000A259942|nr:DEAD-box ATP-dependent RNA helicase 42 [Babesia sp. Xinjiang]ORM41251.1 DEAD-box ATP-dependent RNA helicase 42 [Babesia sp. Xinjiang]